MLKRYKTIFILIGILAISAGGLLAYAASNLDSILNHYRATVESELSIAVRGKVRIGTLSARLFPVSIAVQGLVISESALTPPISIDQLNADVSLLPLLKSEIVIRAFKLRGLKTFTNQDGKVPLTATYVSGSFSTKNNSQYLLSSVDGELLVGRLPVMLTLEELEIDPLRKNLVLTGGKLSALGGVIRLSGRSTFSGDSGDASVSIKEIALPELFNAVGRALPVTAERGRLQGDIKIILTQGQESIEGELEVSALSGVRYSGANGMKAVKLPIHLKDLKTAVAGSRSHLELSDITAAAEISGVGNFSAQGKAELDLANGRLTSGICTGTSSALDLGKLSVLPGFEALTVYAPSGNSSLRAVLEVKPNGILAGTISGTVHEGAAQYRGQQFREIDGPFSISFLDNQSYHISSPKLALRASFSESKMEGIFDLALPSQSGTISLKAPQVDFKKLSTIVPLSNSISAVTGLGDIDVTLELVNGAPVKAAGGMRFAGGSLEISDVTISDFGAQVDAQSDPRGASFVVSKLGMNLQGKPLSGSLLAFFKDALELRNIDLKFSDTAFTGTIRSVFSGKSSVQAHLKAAGGKISQLMMLRPSTGRQSLDPFEGTIRLVTMKGGSEDVKSGVRALTGELDFIFDDSILRGVNIAKIVFEKLGEVPFLKLPPLADLPESVRSAMAREDTPFKIVSGNIDATSGIFTISNLELQSDMFRATGYGTMSVGADENKLALHTIAALNREVTELFTKRVAETRSLVNARGELEIPMVIQGTLQSPQVLPDVKSLIQRGAGSVVRDSLINLINKSLHKNSRAPGASRDSQSTDY